MQGCKCIAAITVAAANFNLYINDYALIVQMLFWPDLTFSFSVKTLKVLVCPYLGRPIMCYDNESRLDAVFAK